MTEAPTSLSWHKAAEHQRLRDRPSSVQHWGTKGINLCALITPWGSQQVPGAGSWTSTSGFSTSSDLFLPTQDTKPHFHLIIITTLMWILKFTGRLPIFALDEMLLCRKGKFCGTQRHVTTSSHLMSSRYLEIKISITDFWQKYSFI